MAEDGMLMNFSIGADSLGTRTVFKGGRWRDRLQAKKSSQRRRETRQTNGTLTGSNAVPTKARETATPTENVPRPAKKLKLNSSTYQRGTRPALKAHEVVSSLFTYNPVAKTPTSAVAQTDEQPGPSPSNAPLPASLSTFTSLGLSPFLSTHLIQTLHLTAPTAIQKEAITQLLREDSDAFIQAETGSGKTLAYLLPIVQRIMALSKPVPSSTESGRVQESGNGGKDQRKINRMSGLFAIVLAPTRELTHQISAVLTRLLRPLPWLVAGTVTGGAHKNHEKARLRKGLNILVATPGRLADHLENTEVLDVSTVRWLVLDEGDRLMELGFEEDIKGIVQKMEERKEEKQRLGRPGKEDEWLPERRTTVMCSATMKMGVQRLGDISLRDAVHIKAESGNSRDAKDITGSSHINKETTFLAPAQLRQSHIVVPPKQRLVTLTALLKQNFARKGSVMKAVVFLSCADSVDFHFELLARKEAHPQKESTSVDGNIRNPEIHHASPSPEITTGSNCKSEKLELPTVAPTPTLASIANPNLTLYKLHGSLTQPIRTGTLQSFSRSNNPSILLCTDVASRGLDLPDIDLVIEYDPPFCADDHLHRVGRTARAGKEGRACCFLMPGPEEGYVEVLKGCAGESTLKSQGAEEVLRKGFACSVTSVKDKKSGFVSDGGNWDEKATEWQLAVERWVIEDKRAGEMARKAFVSHVRAYATHVAKERGIFNVKSLHLGHLAKAFALRERPANMGRRSNAGSDKPTKRDRGQKKKSVKDDEGGDRATDNKRLGKADLDLPANDGQDAARKMRVKLKEHTTGASEFNIG